MCLEIEPHPPPPIKKGTIPHGARMAGRGIYVVMCWLPCYYPGPFATQISLQTTDRVKYWYSGKTEKHSQGNSPMIYIQDKTGLDTSQY